MPSSKLPENASLEYLKKLAKQRLRELRRTEPTAKLASAQLAVAREHGFTSWRALKAELDRRGAPAAEALFNACRAGDDATVRQLLAKDPSLARQRGDEGSTGLHLAAAHAAVVRALLEHGADPNARDAGDNALPLHFAAGAGCLESVRALLDAGSDVDGHGDAHEAGVIGWAACGHEPHRDVVALLVERGARHHVFSAIAMGDPDLVQRVVEHDPNALRRRRSRFENGQTPLHFALFPPDGLSGRRALPQYGMLELLIDLGADLEAADAKGRTVLELAMLRGEKETIRRLRAAGAKESKAAEIDASTKALSALGSSVRGLTPMLRVADMEASIAWYTAIGFQLARKNEHDGVIDWASLVFGRSEIMLVPGGDAGGKSVTLWFHTDQLDDLYAALKARQLRLAGAGAPLDGPEVCFVEDLYEAFYGVRQFSVADPDGYVLYFAQPVSWRGTIST